MFHKRSSKSTIAPKNVKKFGAKSLLSQTSSVVFLERISNFFVPSMDLRLFLKVFAIFSKAIFFAKWKKQVARTTGENFVTQEILTNFPVAQRKLPLRANSKAFSMSQLSSERWLTEGALKFVRGSPLFSF